MADQKDDDQAPAEDTPSAAPVTEEAEASEGAEATAEASESAEATTEANESAEATAEASESADGVVFPPEEAGEMLQLFGSLMQKLGRAAQAKSKTASGEGGIPKGVTEMISKVVEQVREKGAEAAEDARRLADNVVDLDAERRKREVNRGPTAFETKFQSTLKEAFSEYVEENLVGEENGERVVRVDLDLVKNHGLALGAHLLRSLADGLVPDEYRVNVPGDAPEGETAEGESTEGAESADGVGANDGVAIEFDLQSFFKRWIAPRPAPPEGD